MVEEIEKKLGENVWLGGQQPSKDDAEKFAALGAQVPNVATHPNAFSWYMLVSRFGEDVRATWTAATAQNQAQAAPAQGKQAAKGGKDAKKPQAAAADGAAAASGDGAKGKKAGKKDDKKNAKELAKQERLRKRQEEEAKKNEFVKDPDDRCADKFGDLPLNRSQCDPELRFQKQYVDVKNLDASLKDQDVRIRCRVHNARKQSKKMCFVVGRQGTATVQAVLNLGDAVSEGMITYSSKIPNESIIEIVAQLVVPDRPIKGCTQ